MNRLQKIPTNRLEALSDGIIAIIITIMVFDVKLTQNPTPSTLLPALLQLLPKVISYSVSFLMVAIMWVNHHQLFYQVAFTNRRLLWYNLHLLFWMSLIPFVTHLMGINPMIPISCSLYSLVFFCCALAFTLLRQFLIQQQLLHEFIDKKAHFRIKRKNYVGMLLYLLAAIGAFISVYISFCLLLLVPALYFIPEQITTMPDNELPKHLRQ